MSSFASPYDDLLADVGFAANPYPAYTRLRSEAPVHWSETWHCWLLTRYEDCDAVLRDTGRFTNVGRIARFLDTLSPSDRQRARPLYDHFAAGLNHSDPPSHTRMRGLVAKALTPKAVAASGSRIADIVNAVIDRALPTGRMELIGDLAAPLPATVLCDLFGFPIEDQARFTGWSRDIVTFHGTGAADPDAVFQSQQAVLEARAWLGELVAARQREPRDDLLTALAQAEEQGDRLDTTELLSTCVTFMVGGHETTTNLIGNGMLALCRHPDVLAQLRKQPDAIDAVVEEVLRFDAPVQRAQRLATEDVELGGRQIRQGDLVEPVLGAANRDPDRFQNPDRLRLDRGEGSHLTFGVGCHFCIGAALARLEGAIAIGTLARRLSNLRVDEGEMVAWRPNTFFRGLRHLHLRFDPTAP